MNSISYPEMMATVARMRANDDLADAAIDELAFFVAQVQIRTTEMYKNPGNAPAVDAVGKAATGLMRSTSDLIKALCAMQEAVRPLTRLETRLEVEEK